MAFFGIVILLKPMVPLSPVTVKDIIVELANWFSAIVALDIWKLVMLPLKARLTVPPISVLADTIVPKGIEEGNGVVVGIGGTFGLFVGVGVEIGVRVEV